MYLEIRLDTEADIHEIQKYSSISELGFSCIDKDPNISPSFRYLLFRRYFPNTSLILHFSCEHHTETDLVELIQIVA